MLFTRAMVAVRRTRTAQCFAALLVVLIVLPFTPPYSTCALSDFTGEAVTHDGDASLGKSIEDVATTLSMMIAVVPIVASDAARPSFPPDVFIPLDVRSNILRL
jgi:hypothetical protein